MSNTSFICYCFCCCCCCLFQVESAKALCRLTERVSKLLTDSLFYEALNGIREWIDQAGVDTKLAEVEAEINEMENIVRVLFPFNQVHFDHESILSL